MQANVRYHIYRDNGTIETLHNLKRDISLGEALVHIGSFLSAKGTAAIQQDGDILLFKTEDGITLTLMPEQTK